MTQTFWYNHKYLQNFSISASMSDLVMFLDKEEFKLRHTLEDTKPSSELTISNRIFLKNSISPTENLEHFLFYKEREKNDTIYLVNKQTMQTQSIARCL
jgi:hypothetical protein